MLQSKWLHVGDVVKMHAINIPDKVAIKDEFRQATFKEWEERANRLANALSDMGMKKGDRFAILAYNCIEWMEIYAAAAKGGQITVPIMFRLAPPSRISRGTSGLFENTGLGKKRGKNRDANWMRSEGRKLGSGLELSVSICYF